MLNNERFYFAVNKDSNGKIKLEGITQEDLSTLPLVAVCNRVAECSATWGTYFVSPKLYTFGRLDDVTINGIEIEPFFQISFHDSMRYNKTFYYVKGRYVNGESFSMYVSFDRLFAMKDMIELYLNTYVLLSLCDDVSLFNDILATWDLYYADMMKLERYGLDGLKKISETLKAIEANHNIMSFFGETLLHDISDRVHYSIRRLASSDV